jgi:hypothetical protein
VHSERKRQRIFCCASERRREGERWERGRVEWGREKDGSAGGRAGGVG